MQRILIIVAGIIVVIGVLIAIYFLFFASSSPKLTTAPETNPFADTGASDKTTTAVTQNTDTGVAVTSAGKELAPSLVQITDHPVAQGAIALYIPPQVLSTASTTASTSDLTPTQSEVEVRYIDRASGNIYSYRVHDRILTRLSNKTLPGIQHAYWLADGSLAFTQYISKDDKGTEHVETYALPLSGEGGYFLERDLDQIMTSASSTVFSLISNASGSTGTFSKPDGSGAKLAFSSALSSITVQFAGKNLVAYTKPSASIFGYGFTVDTTGAFTRTLGPLAGLSVLPSPSGKKLLYSYNDRGTMRLAVYDTGTQTATLLPIATLSEKCVWAKNDLSIYCGVPTSLTGTLPDDWYQGATTFSDRIWQIDLASRVSVLVVDPSQVAKKDIDATALTIDPKSDVLIFMNKTDGSLYAYDL